MAEPSRWNNFRSETESWGHRIGVSEIMEKLLLIGVMTYGH